MILLSLAALGVLPWFQNNGGSAQSFSQARASAQAAADNYAGGPWTLVAAAGAVPSASMSLPIDSTVGNYTSGSGVSGGCSFSALAQGNLTIGGSQNVSGGLSHEWVFLFKSTGGGALFVSDNDGSVQLVGTLTGSVCSTVFGEIGAIPSTVVDSTTAAATVGADGGYAFLRAHPGANTTVEIIGGVSLFGVTAIPAEWLFSYSTCPINLGGGPTTTTGSGADFVANVSITTGAVLGATTGSCGSGLGPPPPPTEPAIGSDLAFSGVAEASAGATHWYNASVVYASGTLTYSDLQFGVVSASGAPVSLAVPTLRFLSTTGGTVATYDLTTGSWSTGGPGLIGSGVSLALSTTTDLTAAGDTLVVTGTPGIATGTIVLSIP